MNIADLSGIINTKGGWQMSSSNSRYLRLILGQRPHAKPRKRVIHPNRPGPEHPSVCVREGMPAFPVTDIYAGRKSGR